MQLRRVLLTSVGVLLLTACSDDQPASTKATAAGAPTAPPLAMAEVVVEATTMEYRYDPQGKPDPFQSFVRLFPETGTGSITPLERFDLSQLQVTGIIWKTTGSRALIEDPAGKGYIVEVGSAVGKNKGKIVGIQDNRVRVKETYVDFHDRATTKEVDLYLYAQQRGE